MNSVSDLDFLSIPADRKRKYMQHSEQYTNYKALQEQNKIQHDAKHKESQHSQANLNETHLEKENTFIL